MADIIELLPDSVANQIAAGEVIQRPASVVKELLENSVDAGADKIQLIIKDAGKTLIKTQDNGCGMSETDSRMCFERHATSKIRAANDLFAIQTKGFRGEAMASIAAISHIEMRTRKTQDELGTLLEIEGSTVKSQEPCGCGIGTMIAVKNLFFNVPARRKFLKSDPVETRHIIDEFQRVALAHPDIEMSFHHNEKEVFNLPKGSFRQRIVAVFGKKHNEKIVPVEEDTSIVKITGFIGKPEFARKQRSEQFFFVNNRFIKNHYLSHAVANAYDDLIQKDNYPSYFLKLDIDPSIIDINIHPTKTEIKFEDERSIYAVIRSSVKQSLGKYHVVPSLDFNTETSFDVSPLKQGQPIQVPNVTVDKNYNPFVEGKSTTFPKKVNVPANWDQLYPKDIDHQLELTIPTDINHTQPSQSQQNLSDELSGYRSAICWQLHGTYIVTPIKTGMMLIHQQRAHERILFEGYIQNIAMNTGNSQQLLFPQKIELGKPEIALISELHNELAALGFEINEINDESMVIQGVPVEAIHGNNQEIIESLLEQFQSGNDELKLSKQERLARSLAAQTAIKKGKKMEHEEMTNLIDSLFACEIPYFAPNGLRTVSTYSLEEIEQGFITE